jgi:DNA topoisomerase-2
MDALKSKTKGVKITKAHVKNHLFLFVNSAIENPTFDAQTKETLTLPKAKFGSEAPLSDSFMKAMMSKSTGIVDAVMRYVTYRSGVLSTVTVTKKVDSLRGIPKLDDANNAGTKKSLDCTLILTEGDSAKSLAISGLSVVGRDNYGVFPLVSTLFPLQVFCTDYELCLHSERKTA